MIEFFVAGDPVPQGSSRAFVVKGRAVITHANKGTTGWRQRIATEAQKAAKENNWEFIRRGKDQAVGIGITFAFLKPKSLSKSERMMTKRPDIDKLTRACLDALTGILFEDDSQVVYVTIRKIYAPEGSGPGALIAIEREVYQ